MENTPLVTRPATALSEKPLEDPLDYLPCSTVVEYKKGNVIYGGDHPSGGVYLVIDGKVKVSRLSNDGRQVLLDIYRLDEFFGESAFLGIPNREELAVALESTRVMIWTVSTIEDLSLQRPKLAIAMMQLMVRRSDDLTARLAIFSVDNIPRRLAKALLYFSERMGHESENGSVQMMALTHEVLGQFVGTSREIVTQWMNQFRREGYLHYSRSGISMRADMIREWLTRRGETIPSGSAEAVLIHRGRAAMAG